MIREKIIKLKNQPKWVARVMFGIGGILGLGLALHMLPIGGSHAKEFQMNDFIHLEKIDGVSTLTVCDAKDDTACITIMDRNLGATSNSITSSDSYGYHFQRGNNHGFLPCTDKNGCESFPGLEATEATMIDTTGFGPGNWFSSNVFRTITKSPYDWSDPKNDNLRGGGGDTNKNGRGLNSDTPDTDRQGLCPEGYHVPSAGEWSQLLGYWASNIDGLKLNEDDGLYYVNSEGIGQQFQADFMIPFAGYRSHDGYVYSMGDDAYLWSSSPVGDYAHGLYVVPGNVSAIKNDLRANAHSVRCFKDSSENSLFEREDITICNKKDDKDCVTMMDRNLGAKEAGTGEKAYGYHFQRGNNHGFLPCTDKNGCDTFPGGEKTTTNETVDTTGFGPGNRFNENIFRVITKSPYDWSDPKNDNLRGGGGDSQENNRGYDAKNNVVINETGRQGPCPEGYHVPSAGERDKLEDIWIGYYGGEYNHNEDMGLSHYYGDGVGTAFQNYFKIPFAGRRDHDGDVYGMGGNAYLWSSSPVDDDAHGLSVGPYDVLASKNDNRATAHSVRCFKDSSANSLPAEFQVNFWQGFKLIFTGNVTSGELIPVEILKAAEQNMNIREGYSFIGWKIKGESDLFAIDKEVVVSDLDLAAVLEVNSYKITFQDSKGVESDIIRKGDYGTDVTVQYPDWTIQGYTISWDKEIPTIVPAEDTIIRANWTINQYTIRFDTDGGNVIPSITADFGTPVVAPENPSKAGYDFAGWDKEIPTTMPAEDVMITAKWTKKQTTSNGGGGGGSTLRKDNCPDGDYSDSYYDGTCGEKPIQKDKDSLIIPQAEKHTHNSAASFQFDTLTFNPHYSDEMNQAYQYAYHYGITTKSNIRDAAMNWELTRIAMAKMLSQYAINVLGIQPDTSKQNDFKDVSAEFDAEYDNGVTLAYQLGIMGINMPGNNFRPYGYVTRAEFATALSRLLYNTPDGEYAGTNIFYTNHMDKLSKEGIITNTDPNMKELRGYVMIMLMRSGTK